MSIRGWQPLVIAAVLVLSAAGAGVVLDAGPGGGASAASVDRASDMSVSGQPVGDSSAVERPQSDGPITDVEIQRTDAPVRQGFYLRVDFRINGSVANETARLVVENETVDTIEYDGTYPGFVESSAVADTDDISPGTHELTVQVGNVSDSVQITVLERPNNASFSVDVTEIDDPVPAGELLVVDFEVQNVGRQNGTQTVSLDVDNETVDAKTLTLSPKEQDTVKLAYQTTKDEVGELHVTAHNPNTSVTRTVTVTEPEQASPPKFELSVTEPLAYDAVAAGERRELFGYVRNSGGQAGIETLTLEVDNQTVDSKTFVLRPGEYGWFALDYQTSREHLGILEYSIHSANISYQSPVPLRVYDPEIREYLTVDSMELAEPVEAGENLTIIAIGNNLGRAGGLQNISLEVENRTVDTESVVAITGYGYKQRLTYRTKPNETGKLNVTVRTENTSASRTVTVLPRNETGNESDEVVHWQVDFGAGAEPPDPPSYWPRDLLAALGNSEDGVTQNPSVYRARNESQLGAVDIVDEEFKFDDDGNPTEVTVEFEVEADAEARDLHLAVYTLPGPFTMDEIEEQELFGTVNGNYEAGETGELTVPIPQPSDVPENRTVAPDSVDQPIPVKPDVTGPSAGHNVFVPLDLLV